MHSHDSDAPKHAAWYLSLTDVMVASTTYLPLIGFVLLLAYHSLQTLLTVCAVVACVGLFLFGHLRTVNRRLRHANSALHSAAYIDELTGLPNSRAFGPTLRRILAAARRAAERSEAVGSIALIMFDLDNFKQYNELFGHPAADLLISELVHVVQAVLRTDDAMFRVYSRGDEFAVIATCTDAAAADMLAEKIRAKVSAHSFGCGNVTITLGYALAPCDAVTADALVLAADHALCTGKHAGRNCVVRVATAA